MTTLRHVIPHCSHPQPLPASLEEKIDSQFVTQKKNVFTKEQHEKRIEKQQKESDETEYQKQLENIKNESYTIRQFLVRQIK